MITGDAGRVKITADVLIPAGNALRMGFEAKSVQFPLANGRKALSHFTRRTIFGFFRQQIITEIIGGLQESVHMFRQADRGGLG